VWAKPLITAYAKIQIFLRIPLIEAQKAGNPALIARR
jgi:hypothetical protein